MQQRGTNAREPECKLSRSKIISNPPPTPSTMTPLVKRCMDVVWRQWLVVNICAYIPATDDSSTAHPPPCFSSSRAYSLRGDRAVPFRSLWPPSASQKICITTGPSQPLTASTMIPDISKPRNHKHECSSHFNLGKREIIRYACMGRRPKAQCCLCFSSLGAAQIATAQPLNSGFSSLPVVFFSRKPLLACFQAHPCLIENNQRGLSSMWGAAQLARMKEWGDGRGPARLGAPKWKPNGQPAGWGGLSSEASAAHSGFGLRRC